MKNLAGNKDCDEYIRVELAKAHVEVIQHNEIVPHSEVPTKLTGRLGAFTFERAWYYWIVDGNVPLNIAEEIFADPNGVTDVRVNGHCGCPPPETQAYKFAPDSRQVISDEHYDEHIAFLKEHPDWKLEPIENGYVRASEALEFKAFVTSYHIDTQEGLNLFTQKLREHGLDKENSNG